MEVEVLYDVAVSQNVDRCGEQYSCAYPLTALMSDGTLVCAYRIGKEKHSYDGIWVTQSSTNSGRDWLTPVTVFDGRSLNPHQSVVSGGVCQTQDGSLLTVFAAVEVTKADQYVFSDGGFEQRYRCYTARSNDGGRSWSSPGIVEHAPDYRMGITGKPLVLPGWELFIPAERSLPNGITVICASYSSDCGRTLTPFRDCITDVTAKLNYCDARFAILPGGKIMAMLWTFSQDNEETIEVHRSISADNGRTWSSPRPVGYLGQITVPLVLNCNVILAASNYRNQPEGIRLWISRDEGNTWLSESPIQMWDPHKNRVMGCSVPVVTGHHKNDGVWKALDGYTFGTPDLLALPDGTILLSYYATISDVTHIRTCRFKTDVCNM